jgi:hypothetical protein
MKLQVSLPTIHAGTMEMLPCFPGKEELVSMFNAFRGKEIWGCDNPVMEGVTGNTDQLTWQLCPNGTLFISGEGSMSNWSAASQQSWISVRNQITSVRIGVGVTMVGIYAFSDFINLIEVSIPESITIIGERAFENCRSLTKIIIPDLVRIIARAAFHNCSSLTSIIIPSSVTLISDLIFVGCSGLTSVTIPNLVTSIGFNAFENCSSLIEIINHTIIPPTVNNNAFRGSTPLSNITLRVPAQSVTAYQNADVWRNFDTIVAI